MSGEKEIMPVQFFTPLTIQGITYLRSFGGRIWLIYVERWATVVERGDLVLVRTAGGYFFKGEVLDVIRVDKELVGVEIKEIEGKLCT